jgi:hypothetical protein
MTAGSKDGVRSTTVKYTGSGKPFGADIFISVETVHEFSELADDETVVLRQQEISTLLTAQVTDLIKQAAESVREQIAATPKGQVSVHAVAPAAPSPAYASRPAPVGTSAPAVVAVANGAVTSQGEWVSVPSRFGDGQVRFLSSAVYSSDQLKTDVSAWISSNGLDPAHFDIWDERIGPRGAEAGNPIGSVFTIKIKRDSHGIVPADFQRNAAGRGKFNNDGSINPYWSKDFDAFLKYGGRDQLALG